MTISNLGHWEKAAQDWAFTFAKGSRIVDAGNPDKAIAARAPEFAEPVAVPLHPEGFAFVDLDDLDLVADYTWRALKTKQNVYAVSHEYGSSFNIYMHRLVADPGAGLVVDHADGDGLNNCRSNLRVCSMAQNRQNALVDRDKKYSGFKGVCRQGGCFLAVIQGPGQRQTKTFYSEIEAAKWYDAKAREFYGEFACVNFPGDGERSALRLSA